MSWPIRNANKKPFDTRNAGSTLSQEEMRSEANNLSRRLLDSIDSMNPKEAEFIHDMCEKFDDYGDRTFVSQAQLFWLRDLNLKY